MVDPAVIKQDGLNAIRIVDTALVLLDAEGLDAVTMRRLATEMGTGPSSLYRHVSGMREVWVLLVEKVIEEVPLPDLDTEWGNAVGQMARDFRVVMLAHENLIPALVVGQMLGPTALIARERGIAIMLRAGFSPVDAVAGFISIIRYTLGHLILGPSAAGRPDSVRAEIDALVADLDPEQFPASTTDASAFAGVAPDEDFERGLQALLVGIESRRPR